MAAESAILEGLRSLKQGSDEQTEKLLREAFLEQPQQMERLLVKLQQADAAEPIPFFLEALALYRRGRIAACRERLQQALRLGFEWEEETAVDRLAEALLPLSEFHDFETLYLDVLENQSRNRWLSIALPVQQWLTAPAEQRGQRIELLVELLSPGLSRAVVENGYGELERIVEDSARKPEFAAWGAAVRPLLREHRLSQAAELILGLTLEHLAQFADFFGLSREQITASELQRLLLDLPLRLAVALFVLYALSRPKALLNDRPLPEEAAGLLAAAFISFYQQADCFRPLDRNTDYSHTSEEAELC